MPASRALPFGRLGCGYVLLTVVVSCVLLVGNGLLVKNVFFSLGLPEFMREPRWAQAIVFLGPVLLLVVQWWAYDVTVDWLLPMRERRGEEDAKRIE